MEEAVIRRIPPHNQEAEKSVIGSMLMSREAVIAATEILTKDDFYESRYGLVFDAFRVLNEEGKAIDPINLQEKLREMDAPQELCEPEFIRTILTSVPTSANIRDYATIVKEKSTLRRLLHVSEEIANRCYEDHEELQAILDDTEKQVFSVLQQRSAADSVPIMEIALKVLDNIEMASRTSGHVTGLPTGFIELDHKTSGFQNSDMILVAARPSMGKTAFVLNIAQQMAFKRNIPVAIFSLEMSREQLMNRLVAMESLVDAQHLRNGNLSDDEWSKVIEGVTTIGHSPMVIDDTPGITLAEMRSKARKYKLDHDIKIIFIDYLQLMTTGSGGKSQNRQQEISDISRALKSLARELNIPIVALSQLNRSVEQRDDHRPMMSDLRESGAIEQDADVIMFIYRDDYYHKDTEEKNVAEIIIAKQRNGPIGTVKLVWMPEYTKFGSIEKKRE
ncbi:MAG: replicative DNA helicase [Lachnospiraceae bacterium]|nr:replicative DNA helicase [Lachnospiraceae bacterium]